MIKKYHNITHFIPTYCAVRKSPRTITTTRHQEDKQSKATNSLFLFLIKMIAKLERKQSNAQQTTEHTQSPTMEATINNNRTATLESTAA